MDKVLTNASVKPTLSGNYKLSLTVTRELDNLVPNNFTRHRERQPKGGHRANKATRAGTMAQTRALTQLELLLDTPSKEKPTKA